jgi:hypothetical protein
MVRSGALFRVSRGVMRAADQGNSSRDAVWSDPACRGHPMAEGHYEIGGSHSGVTDVTSGRLEA